MTEGVRASAIVLAGGRSSRFGRDKLVEPVGATTLLDHAIAAAVSVASDVVVVGRTGRPTSQDPGRSAIRYISDETPFGGPLLGLAAGLTVVGEPLSLVVGGDMPALVPAILERLLATLLEDDRWDVACLVHEGRRQPLPLAVRVARAAPAVQKLVDSGERRLLGIFTALATRALVEDEWRALDPGAATLRDVDRPIDLPPS